MTAFKPDAFRTLRILLSVALLGVTGLSFANTSVMFNASAGTNIPIPKGAALADQIDVIFAIDTSASMSGENAELSDQIYDHLIVPLESYGKNVRVIVVAKFGTSNAEVCFENPLGAIPFGGCDFSPPEPANTDQFRHYSASVQSLDAWCKLIRTFDGSLADDFGMAPNGWSSWLRQDAFKFFIIVSDDRSVCTISGGPSYNDNNNSNDAETTATSFIADLLALSPTQFGTVSNRKFVVHSLIGVPEQIGASSQVYPPLAPLQINDCSTASSPGLGHQALSRFTGGLRFTLCSLFQVGYLYDEFLEAVAQQVDILFANGLEDSPVVR